MERKEQKAKDCGILLCRVAGTCHRCEHLKPHNTLLRSVLALLYTYLRENEASKIAKTPFMKYESLKFQHTINQV